MAYRVEQKVEWDTKRLVTATSDFFDAFRKNMLAMEGFNMGERTRIEISHAVRGEQQSPVRVSGKGFAVEYSGPVTARFADIRRGIPMYIVLDPRFTVRGPFGKVMSPKEKLDFYTALRETAKDPIAGQLGLVLGEKPFAFVFPKETYGKSIYRIVQSEALVPNKPPLIRPGEEVPKLIRVQNS